MHSNHLYETIMVFLSGVGIGVYIFELRHLCRAELPLPISGSVPGARV